MKTWTVYLRDRFSGTMNTQDVRAQIIDYSDKDGLVFLSGRTIEAWFPKNDVAYVTLKQNDAD